MITQKDASQISEVIHTCKTEGGEPVLMMGEKFGKGRMVPSPDTKDPAKLIGEVVISKVLGLENALVIHTSAGKAFEVTLNDLG